MHNKLAGHLPLQEMIAQTIESARSKVAAVAESKKTEKVAPAVEKTASAHDMSDTNEIEKLASALEDLAEKLAGNKIEIGSESKQGGEVLPTGTPVGGKQPYKNDKARNAVPVNDMTLQAGDAGNKASTQVKNDHAKAAPTPYPKKGVMKTAGEAVAAKIAAQKQAGVLPPALAANAGKVQAAQDPKKPGAEKPDLGEKGKECKDCKKAPCVCSEKKSSAALDFLLGKVAESEQGGMVLTDDKAGNNPKPESGGSNSARSAIGSNQAAINMKKIDGKAPQKKQLAEVLTEPAQSKATDSKIHENLRSAGKAGVKIAAATAFLQKIASDEKDPRHEKLKAALEKAKQGKGKEKESGSDEMC